MAPRRRVVAESESESEPDQQTPPSAPSDDTLEKALRDVVADIYKSGNMEELTVKRVRVAAEKALAVEEGFFKGSSIWKSKSDQIIKDEVEVQDKQTQGPGSDEEKEEEPSSPPAAKKATSVKRAKPDKAVTTRKRRKASTPESEDQDESSALPDDASEDEVKKPAKRQTPSTQEKTSDVNLSNERVSDESDSVEDEKEGVRPSDASEEPKFDRKDDSESEMSVVLDEEPNPIRRRQKSASSEGATRKGKKATTTKAKDTKAKEPDPDQAEIKRLQGWLIKCGIRKMWARELAPYDTPKTKIKHLKGLLKEAGMDGRYSLDKAKKIKEERELKADLEMVQEGAKRWGTGGADENSDQGRPRRRLNRGRQSLAFLESDGEETD